MQKLSAHGAFDVGEAGAHNRQKADALDCFTRTTRRSVLYALGAAAIVSTKATTGAVGKRNIREFGKVFAYLKDPALRSKEVGDAVLTVEGAEFSGERFEGMEWRNIVFKNCDFIGGCAQPVLTQSLVLRNSRFESLRSSGLNAAYVLLEGNQIGSVNRSNTQTKESRVQPLAKGQAKLDGSNIKA